MTTHLRPRVSPIRRAITPSSGTAYWRWGCKSVTALQAARACVLLAQIHCHLPFSCRGTHPAGTFPRPLGQLARGRFGQWVPLVGNWVAGGREKPDSLSSHSASVSRAVSWSFGSSSCPLTKPPELWKYLFPMALQFKGGNSVFCSGLSYHFLFDFSALPSYV